MSALLKITVALDRIVSIFGRVAAWAIVPLVVVVIFDVISRRFFVVGSTELQELEWHLHAVLFMFCLGYGYLREAHVRVDLLSTHFSDRVKLWIELLGSLLFLIPFCAVVIYFGATLTYGSLLDEETSASATGLTHRWIIRSVIPLGMLVLLLSAMSSILKSVAALSGVAVDRRLTRAGRETDVIVTSPLAKGLGKE
ncbi:TRAP transporter small permease subunit [Rhodospirillaceae bacterium SYSU D60014]|uniref:TRAP transporter small permease subunit n=1 Tax=Virgifigura deserti TaxID=2268457 RepID=UPI000E674076